MAGFASNEASHPLWLLAELTYRCPMQCFFCSNPVAFAANREELDTEQWLRVLREARELGAVQLGFSGGEPLLRSDLELLVAEADELKYYTNLITSGLGMSEGRLKALKEAGLDHIQLSFQASSAELNDFIGGTKTFEKKREVAKLIKAHGYPMVLNFVLHRGNIDSVESILQMAEELEADYVELANVQYGGWAKLNRSVLMPTRAQLEQAEAAANRFRERIGDRMRIFYVVSDYYEGRPKPCVGGWGTTFMQVTPDGTVLPCHGAQELPGLHLPKVQDASLRSIWCDSDLFARFRGEAWMKEPCRSCPERSKDFGGCRCQAYALTGDPANTDPTCQLSEHHHVVLEAIEEARQAEQGSTLPIFRNVQNSRARQE